MDNYTYYKEEISEILVKGGTVAINSTSGRPCNCDELACDKCTFYKYDRCAEGRRIWLRAEHVDKPILTQDEYKFLSLLKPDTYIARDKNGILYLYNTSDIEKTSEVWKLRRGDHDSASQRIDTLCSCFMNTVVNLSFIKWEDEKPWKVEDLLKLEVK